jgi:hypothetical protein
LSPALAESATRFVRLYFAELDSTIAGRSNPGLSTMYEPGCILCTQDAITISQYLRDGNKMVNAGYTVISARAVGIGAGLVPVVISLRNDSGSLVSKSGTLLKSFEANSDTVIVNLRVVSSGFKIVEISPT